MDIAVTVSRLPVPGATVLGGGAAYAPGGKGANQAVAAARLGARVRMTGCVGDDDFGARLRAALTREGVGDEGVRTVPGAPTGLAMITVDEAGENMITVAPGANHEVGAAEIATVAATPSCDALVISAEIPVEAIKSALGITGPALRILNLAPALPSSAELLATGVDWLVVNESEAAAILGTPVSGLDGAAAAAPQLAELGARNVVVTAGAAGAAYCGRPDAAEIPNRALASGDARIPDAAGVSDAAVAKGGGVVMVPGFRVHAVDSVGAGDTFVGALAVTLAAGVPAVTAVRAASAAGAAAATRPGTQSGMPSPADVLAATGFSWPV